MSKLKLIIKNEVMTDLTSKSFWVMTLVVPVLYVVFGLIVGMMAAESDTFAKFANPTAPDEENLSGWQIAGMMGGLLLTLFLMIYGSQIYAKVRKEKINRIMEVLATSVTGRTLMIGKVISVLIVGFVQLAVWVLFGLAAMGIFIAVAAAAMPMDWLAEPHLWLSIMWLTLFFFGGYLFYGSIYAACGAITDKDNENQGYMTAITMLLLISMYVGQFAVDNGTSAITQICCFVPFTAPSVCTVAAFAGDMPVWETALQCIILYGWSFLALSFSGKIYTSSILLKGRKFSPKDIVLFLKAK